MQFYIYTSSLIATAQSYDQLTQALDTTGILCLRKPTERPADYCSAIDGNNYRLCPGGEAIQITEPYHGPSIHRQIGFVNTVDLV